jgi:hypothetical protein
MEITATFVGALVDRDITARPLFCRKSTRPSSSDVLERVLIAPDPGKTITTWYGGLAAVGRNR